MTERLIYVFGAGGHGKVVADIILSGGGAVTGFVDDAPRDASARVLGRPVILFSQFARIASSSLGVGVALGVGDNEARARIMRECEATGAEVLTVVHPKAAVAASAKLGQGTVVMAGAAVNAEASLGRGVIVNTGAVVEHDNVIGEFAHLSPNAATGGAVRIGAFTHCGLGAVVLPGVTVGSRCIIGAGAVVISDIPDGVIAIGVPARVHERSAAKG